MSDKAAADATQARDTLARLRHVLKRGATIREAGRVVPGLGGSPWRAYRLAVKHNLPRRRRGLAPATSQAIERHLRQMRSINAIARALHVSTKTVWKRKVARDGPGPRPCRPYRCPRGHFVKLTPCVQCAALEALARTNQARTNQARATGK